MLIFILEKLHIIITYRNKIFFKKKSIIYRINKAILYKIKELLFYKTIREIHESIYNINFSEY